MSAAIGGDKRLVQGAGGNVSLKEDGVLWVKASGKWLSDAQAEAIFVPLALGSARERALADSEDFAPCALHGATLKPSIETGMHALLPQRVVLHVHSVNVLCHAVLAGGEEAVRRALPGDVRWAWVPYARPGAPLISQIRSRIDRDCQAPLVLILANHGLVVAADGIDEAWDLLRRVEAGLHVEPRPLPSSAEDPRLDEWAARIGGRRPKDAIAAVLALDPAALAVARKGPLYPDHVVFLGAAPSIRTPGEMADFDWEGGTTPYVIIEQADVLVSRGITDNAEAMLACWAEVAARVGDAGSLAPLPEAAILELAGWDAEKYRQILSRIRRA